MITHSVNETNQQKEQGNIGLCMGMRVWGKGLVKSEKGRGRQYRGRDFHKIGVLGTLCQLC